MSLRNVFYFSVLLLLCGVLATALAETPKLINFQGILLDTAGDPVTVPTTVIFAIWNAETDGDSLWSEEQSVTPDDQGRFSILLGSESPIPDSAFADPETYLSLKVDTDPEIIPRQRLASVAYAYRDNDWTLTSDVLYTGDEWGLARAGNILYGDHDSTHVNLGVACTTGTSGQNREYATVGGGLKNTAAGHASTVGGGQSNTASNTLSTVGGGGGNDASGENATVGGGYFNIASSTYATVGGGMVNNAISSDATVGGGEANTASGLGATVSGGVMNTASGSYATVPGGQYNTAGGDNSFATGRRAKAYHDGAFVWGAGSDADFVSSAANQFLIRAGGGVGIGTNSPSTALEVNGTVTATAFVGDGSGLTGVGADNLGDHTATQNIQLGSYWLSGDGGSEGISVDNAGLVGIGTASPSTALEVNGTVTATAFLGDGSGLTGIAGDNDWTLTSDVLYTGDEWGLARAGNTLYGDHDSTHVNLGVACTTGTGGQNYNYATVGGGYKNTAAGRASTVGGGRYSTTSGDNATVGGGYRNTASSQSATVPGGYINTASSDNSTVGGGFYNVASNYAATVSGGDQNTASGDRATVGGGEENSAEAYWATVSGGYQDTASGNCATVSGGYYNIASSQGATVSGGQNNTASGQGAAVAGGYNNTASGYYSFAAGRRAKANHNGTFVWGDGIDADFASTAVDQFLIRAGGGVGIGTNIPSTALEVNGTVTATAFVGDGSGLTGLAVGADNLGDHTATQNIQLGSYWLSGDGGSEGISVDNAGLVGVGTAIPSTALEVNGTVTATAFVGDGSGLTGLAGGNWTLTSDVLYTNDEWGLARAGNTLYGDNDSTHVNFGVACTTGTSGQNYLHATVGGGLVNAASGDRATVGGGGYNTASGDDATVSGGSGNTASGDNATVSGGGENVANGFFATAHGGYNSTASGQWATVGGGAENTASGLVATVTGGSQNTASSDRATVGGGVYNTASGDYATVPGGRDNTASGDNSFAAGRRSKANHNGAFVWGDNTDADFASSAVDQFLIRAGGGVGIGTNSPSTALEVNGTVTATAFVGDGSGLTGLPVGSWTLTGDVLYTNDEWGLARAGNTLYGDHDSTHVNLGVACITGYPGQNYRYATVGGGYGNAARGDDAATVGGGRLNTASGDAATVGGGSENIASYYAATVGGGYQNTASGHYATVGGGTQNTASGLVATVTGGSQNTASAERATVGGGVLNTASGEYATIPGGQYNTAGGDNSFAAGYRAQADHNGTFVWGDVYAADFTSTAANQFLIRAGGGVGIGTNSPNSQLSLGGSLSVPLTSESANYTVTDSDHVIVITGSFTVDLPSAVSRTGRVYVVKNAGAGSVSIDADGTETIDGSLTYNLPSQYDVVKIISDGSNWLVIGT